jgi:bifunctional enzyme CysN/CysC
MDLVGYDREAFRRVDEEFTAFSARLRIADLSVIPMSALHGDNVVTRTAAMPWYEGPSLLHHLENVHVAADANLIDLRFPVQYVIRPNTAEHRDYRGYAGRIAAGVLRTGDAVIALPSGITSTVVAIDSPLGPLEEAGAGLSVTVRLADDIDLSRGDVLTRADNQPRTTQDIDAMVCWMTQDRLQPGQRVLVKHTTRIVPALVKQVRYRMDVNTLHRQPADGLGFNEIGRVTLRTTQPVMCDDYQRNRETGGFIMIDPTTKLTVAGGMIRLD